MDCETPKNLLIYELIDTLIFIMGFHRWISIKYWHRFIENALAKEDQYVEGNLNSPRIFFFFAL